MNELKSNYSTDEYAANPSVVRTGDSVSRKLVLRRLSKLQNGRLTLTDGPATRIMGAANRRNELSATITVTDARFYSSMVMGGTVGAAEAYILGYWRCDDLTKLIRILVANRNVLDAVDSGLARLTDPFRNALHWINKNTKSGSRRNISAHYDLGNDFFRLWLDESMTYSSAIFERPDMSLYEASLAKLDRLCRKLELSPGDHVLEIGTGWGGFAIHAATNYGCKVTTTTISREQFEHAKSLVSDAELNDQVTLLLYDYRDLEGQFDKIVSIEMIESVGQKFLDSYFDQCGSLLKPGGMMVLQAITIADQRYKAALKSVDFIQRYIFPGGFLPSVTAILNSMTESTDMRLYHLENIGEHYAKTLKIWRDNFNDKRAEIRSMGFSEEFMRMWEYYYCYCEGAFLERAIGCVQMLFVKPECRGHPTVPAIFND